MTSDAGGESVLSARTSAQQQVVAADERERAGAVHAVEPERRENSVARFTRFLVHVPLPGLGPSVSICRGRTTDAHPRGLVHRVEDRRPVPPRTTGPRQERNEGIELTFRLRDHRLVEDRVNRAGSQFSHRQAIPAHHSVTL